MKLYFAPAACSLAVHIALREAGLAHELAKVDLSTHRLDDGSDYHAVNPRGYVPLLVAGDGTRMTEVAALLQYVAEQAPDSGLLPRAGAARHEVLQWLTFVSTELHKTYSPWLWHKDTAESTRQAVKDKLALRLGELDRLLSHRPFLAGSAFSAADAYAFAVVRWSPMVGVNLRPFPQLQAYLDRVAQRPAVQRALQAEGLVAA